MTEAIYDPEYWARRIREAPSRSPHQAIYLCTNREWEAIEKKHRDILARHIKAGDSILDCGCAWGRLLQLLPRGWKGRYLGVDLCPEFIERARRESFEAAEFLCGDLRTRLKPLPAEPRFDWAVMLSIRPMIRRYKGEDAWREIEAEVRRVADKILYLEYDVNDEGVIE